MTADEAAFLACIRQEPDADLPRLVYADWLQENGREAYAEFIRVQCEMASVPKWDPVWIRAVWMEPGEWLYGHSRAPGKPNLPGCSRTYSNYRRGFPWQLQVQDPPKFLSVAKRTLDQHPFQALHVSWLTFQRPNLRRFMTVRWLGRMRRLVFAHNRFTGEQFEKFLASADLRSLEDLHLEYGAVYRTVQEAILAALVRSPVIQQLRELRLVLNFAQEERGQPIVRTMAGGLVLPKLERLDLQNNAMIGEDILRVLEDLKAPRLNRLDLQHSDLSTAASPSLAASPVLAGIESLDLNSTRPSIEFLLALARSPHLNCLKVLKLQGAVVTPAVWEAFLSADWFAGLHILDLIYTKLDDEAAIALAETPAANLRALVLGTTSITDRGARALLNSPHLNSLMCLRFSYAGTSEKLLAGLRDRFGRFLAWEKPIPEATKP